MEIPQWKVLADTKFWIRDLPTKIFFVCSHTFITGFGHFHGSTWPSPIQVASTLEDHFAAVTSKLCGTQQVNTVHTAPEPVCLERVCHPSAWFKCSRNGAWLWFLSAAPKVPKRSPEYYSGQMLRANFDAITQTMKRTGWRKKKWFGKSLVRISAPAG